jgi:hypothetical protein
MAYTAIDNPELYFQAKLYTGSGGTQSITLDGSEDMQPDFVWIKSRADTNPHTVVDAVRGATKIIWTNVNSIEGTYADEVTSFDSDGFTLGASSNAYANENTETHVAWCWKESVTAGFDIIAYTGQGIDTAFDVSHNLSAVPDWIMIKARSTDQAWRVYHKNMTTADPYSTRMVLSEDGGETSNALGLDADPTSSVINIGTGTGCTNASGATFICYAWTDIQGFSKFGSYTGNGNADGTFIYTGFKPAFFITKNATDAGDNWILWDNKRDTFNLTDNGLAPNSSEAEFTDCDIDFVSNGIKIRNSTGRHNGTGDTHIYMAFAEAPFVNSNGVPCNAR